MIVTIARTLRAWLSPAIDALFARNLPFSYRWRLLALQPISLLAYSIASLPWLFSRTFRAEYLPISPNRTLRVLVFDPPQSKKQNTLRPLHLDVHGGAFIGGLPEANAHFCARLARDTGAIVFSTTYRFAPVHPFPAAIDDVDAVLAYLRAHAVEKYGADPNLVTVSGDSAGGNLALAASLSAPRGVVKASVTFYAAVNLQLKPWEKPQGLPPPVGSVAPKPVKDPMTFLLPLFDSYAGPAREREMRNPRMSPFLWQVEDLPRDMLLVVPTIDILVKEQLEFVVRLKGELEACMEGEDRRVEALYVEKGFHGYLGVPSPVVPQEIKDEAWNAGVKFIRDAHRKNGWRWDF
ncbi:Alpha/Beta hydrolase protein [Podospora conica]|nr:Alpha/Beta hydrolase protein [Schizothecium conicum]